MARPKKSILLQKRRYILDLLSEAAKLECMSVDSPMNVNMKLLSYQREILGNVGRYIKSVGKLNYVTIVTRPDITFTVSVVSRFLSSPRITHLETVMKILRYMKAQRGLIYFDHGHTLVVGFLDANWAWCPFDRRLTT